MMYTLYMVGLAGRGTPTSAPDEKPKTRNYRCVKVYNIIHAAADTYIQCIVAIGIDATRGVMGVLSMPPDFNLAPPI